MKFTSQSNIYEICILKHIKFNLMETNEITTIQIHKKYTLKNLTTTYINPKINVISNKYRKGLYIHRVHF